mgnify:CR=1 FL=1
MFMEGALNYSQIDYMTGQANGMLANGVSLKELSDNKLNPYSDNGVGWLGALGWDGLLFDFKNGEYIEAAKALGANNFRIIVSHILPNIMSPLIVLATLNFGNAVLDYVRDGFFGNRCPASHTGMGCNAVQRTSISVGGPSCDQYHWFGNSFPGIGTQPVW